jgi:4-aminobutyrate aminotransferase-like enzyme
VRMSPPLTATDDDVDRAAESLGASLATSGVPA